MPRRGQRLEYLEQGIHQGVRIEEDGQRWTDAKWPLTSECPLTTGFLHGAGGVMAWTGS